MDAVASDLSMQHGLGGFRSPRPGRRRPCHTAGSPLRTSRGVNPHHRRHARLSTACSENPSSPATWLSGRSVRDEVAAGRGAGGRRRAPRRTSSPRRRAGAAACAGGGRAAGRPRRCRAHSVPSSCCNAPLRPRRQQLVAGRRLTGQEVEGHLPHRLVAHRERQVAEARRQPQQRRRAAEPHRHAEEVLVDRRAARAAGAAGRPCAARRRRRPATRSRGAASRG